MKKFFAKITLGVPGGEFISGGHKIPDGLFSDEQLARFVKKGYVEAVETLPPESTTPPAPPAPSGDKSKWAFDPALLQGASLEALNIKIQEHAATYYAAEAAPPLFDTVEEAIAFLSHERG